MEAAPGEVEEFISDPVQLEATNLTSPNFGHLGAAEKALKSWREVMA